jgi:hypothetical protein
MSDKNNIETQSNNTPEETSDRRSFVKNSFVIAGALAGGAIAANATSANAAPAAAAASAGSKEVLVIFDRTKPITVKDLYEAIITITRRGGCYNCGLIGIDPRFIVRDPVIPLNNGGFIVPEIEEQQGF